MKNLSSKFRKGNRTYFFDVKTSQNGSLYLKVVESKQINDSEFERHQIIIFEEAIEDFVKKILEVANEFQMDKKAYFVDEKSKIYRNAYKPWTEKEDNKLELLYCQGKDIAELTEIFERNKGAIWARIKKLELKEKYDL